MELNELCYFLLGKYSKDKIKHLTHCGDLPGKYFDIFRNLISFILDNYIKNIPNIKSKRLYTTFKDWKNHRNFYT